ncbi:hypothetical protein MTR67_041480 [Solanum verrucosum]|uniref:Uncharacterized protein n=1 Tax=Solanum verrucosum TaxID=315347 RepID=A0AAF0ZSS0_SOLVR|nr:hypothetical protein MTR67_041480 [Solanum verrucosum]
MRNSLVVTGKDPPPPYSWDFVSPREQSRKWPPMGPALGFRVSEGVGFKQHPPLRFTKLVGDRPIQDKAKKNWLERSAELMELDLEDNDSEEERVNNHKRKKATSAQLTNLQEELKSLLSRPLQPKTFSKRYLAGAGVSPLLQNQLEELARQKNPNNSGDIRKKMIVIGQDCVEPLQALRSAGPETKLNLKDMAEKRRDITELRRKRKETKKRLREQRRKQKKKLQGKE